MKIIHCADIHLDSRITANLSATKSKQRKAEVLNSFCNMCDYAVNNGVEVVIIAGDLFDSDRCSDANQIFQQFLSRLLCKRKLFCFDKPNQIIQKQHIPHRCR